MSAAIALRLAPLGLLVAVGAARAQVVPGLPDVDYLRVDKSAHTITLYSQGRPVYRVDGIQLGRHPTGPKHVQGDGRTPEGRYTIDYGNADSSYHLSLHISYPNAQDTANAGERGLSPGGAIFIHGQPNDWRGPGRVPGEWTDGCIAVSNADIELMWRVVLDGATIDIMP